MGNDVLVNHTFRQII